jgi:hypothetical protein
LLCRGGEILGGLTERSTACRQVGEADFELDTDAVRTGYSSNRSNNIAARVLRIEELGGRKCSCVDYSRWVVLDDRSIALDAGDGTGCCLGGDKAEKASQADCDDVGGVHVDCGTCDVRLMMRLA